MTDSATLLPERDRREDWQVQVVGLELTAAEKDLLQVADPLGEVELVMHERDFPADRDR